jgi:hypothetical protein
MEAGVARGGGGVAETQIDPAPKKKVGWGAMATKTLNREKGKSVE